MIFNKIIWTYVGADLSRSPPIHRPVWVSRYPDEKVKQHKRGKISYTLFHKSKKEKSRMQPGKKLLTKLLPACLVLMAMLLVACGGSTSTTTTTSSKAPASQQVLNMCFYNGVSDIKTFDPALTTDVNSIEAINLVFTGLVQFDDNLKIQPQLASSYDLASDGLTWTFHLRPNLKFSDGTPLTSADVVYSINRALLPATKSVVGPVYLALIKDSDKLNAGKIPTIIGDSLLTPDPNTVVIIANKKASYFLNALSYSTSFVVEKSLIDKYGDNWTDHLNRSEEHTSEL